MNSSDPDTIVVVPDPVGDRYGTFGFISWWEQSHVKAASVMVIGAGALGNEVLKGLALTGIGRIFIVDFDTVEPGNLSRCVLFRQRDSGYRKAEIAARAVKDLNPDVQVQWFHGDVNHDLGLGVFRRTDVVVGCLDNREARLSVNRSCYQVQKPWVDGGIESLMGYARVFWPGRGACYECTLTDRDYQMINMRRSCGLLARQNLVLGKVPTTPTAAAIIGGVQTQETLKIINHLEVQAGSSFIFNGLTNDCYVTRLPEREDCLSHSSLDEIIELTSARAATTTVRQMVEETRKQFGPNARLSLGFDLLTGWRCRRCGENPPALKPLHRVFENDALCTKCGVERIPDVTSALTGQERFADQPLSTLGVPPLGILVTLVDNRSIGLELTGDAGTLWTNPLNDEHPVKS
jgi:adenylyltransferase/sulfurtransferase